MKFLTTLFLTVAVSLTAITEDFINGSYYIKSATDGIRFNWIGQSTTETKALVVGKTYASENDMFELITGENQEVILQFSSELLVQVSPNSEFRVDAFNQMVGDSNVQPEVLKAGDFILNTALMNGSVYIIAPEYSSPNTMCVLQTPLMNVELPGGKYQIRTTTKYTIIYVAEGTVGVFDTQTNKKTVKQAGTMVLIFPSPMRSGEVMVTEKNVELDEYKKLLATLKQLETSEPTALFALMDGKIVGIKLQ